MIAAPSGKLLQALQRTAAFRRSGPGPAGGVKEARKVGLCLKTQSSRSRASRERSLCCPAPFKASPILPMWLTTEALRASLDPESRLGLAPGPKLVHAHQRLPRRILGAMTLRACRYRALRAVPRDGVDAPRRHLRAKVTVSNRHARRRPWSRLLPS